MEPLEALIDQIPIRHNAVSYLTFTGVLLGVVLALTIWLRAPRDNRGLHYLALLSLCMAVTTFDTFLCYTGWMKHTLAWNDSTEPLTLLYAPLLFLSIRFLFLRRPLPLWVVGLHLAPAVLYALSQIGYYTSPLAIKFNAYKAAYFDFISFAPVPEGTTYAYHTVKDAQRWLLLFGFLFYGLWALRLWLRHRKDFGSPAADVHISKYGFGRFILVFIGLTLAMLLGVYLNYEDDGGDHYLSLFMFGVILATLLAFLSESRFFQRAWLLDKYETSGGKTDSLSLSRVQEFMEAEAFFTAPEATLKSLAEGLDTHPNTLSRLINQETGGNFNDFLNGYRVRLAIARLESEAYGHLTIEAVGQSVGFRSKSAFYTAFKKHTGASPSQFLRSGEAS